MVVNNSNLMKNFTFYFMALLLFSSVKNGSSEEEDIPETNEVIAEIESIGVITYHPTGIADYPGYICVDKTGNGCDEDEVGCFLDEVNSDIFTKNCNKEQRNIKITIVKSETDQNDEMFRLHKVRKNRKKKHNQII